MLIPFSPSPRGPGAADARRAVLMALYELFSQPVERGYRAGLCSKAALFLLLATALTFLPPLLVAFRSHGEPPRAGARHRSRARRLSAGLPAALPTAFPPFSPQGSG